MGASHSIEIGKWKPYPAEKLKDLVTKGHLLVKGKKYLAHERVNLRALGKFGYDQLDAIIQLKAEYMTHDMLYVSNGMKPYKHGIIVYVKVGTHQKFFKGKPVYFQFPMEKNYVE